MTTSVYARDPITGAYKEINSVEIAAGVWALRVSDPNASGGGGGNTTATTSNVAGSAASVTLLVSNSLRKGFTIHNDSSANLYVKFGATASLTSFTVKMVSQAYFEVPFDYTGRVDGIWDSATGAARVTEITA